MLSVLQGLLWVMLNTENARKTCQKAKIKTTSCIDAMETRITFVVKDGCHYQTMNISLSRFVVATRDLLPSQVCIRSNNTLENLKVCSAWQQAL